MAVTAGEKKFTKEKLLLADSNFFRVFTGQFLQGDAYTALQSPGTVVLSESAAKRFFGSAEQAMDKELMLGFNKVTVSGVCRDWPENPTYPSI